MGARDVPGAAGAAAGVSGVFLRGRAERGMLMPSLSADRCVGNAKGRRCGNRTLYADRFCYLHRSQARMTLRQVKEWPIAIADILRVADVAINPWNWDIDYADEIRPGRGHFMDARYNDGEHFAQIRMDVYGGATTSVAGLTWLHASSDEECDCGCREDDHA